jgi:hypothetical protein
MTYFKGLIIAAALLSAGTVARAGSIIALEVFNYSGTCTDCTFSNGTLLTIASYTPGSPLSTSPFITFTYTSNLVSFTINQNSPGFFVSGGLPATLPGAATLIIQDNQWEFSSNSSGAWFVNQIPADFGPANSWSAASAVPEPGATAMLGLGLAVLAAVRARYRRGRDC